MDEAVELGLPDGLIERLEQEDPFVTKIGGRPTWLHVCQETEKSLVCGICGSALYLLLQMDCPPIQSAAVVDRIIYVFACNTRECTESGKNSAVRVIIQCRKATKTVPEIVERKPTGLWDSIMVDQEISHAVENIILDDKVDEGYYSEQYPVGFPATALRIVDELISIRPTRLIKEIPEMVEEGDGGEGWQGEAYEQMRINGYDKAFKNFHNRVAHYPRQCVRYSPANNPLPFCADELPLIEKCSKCGDERSFELQLMPAVLSCLPKDADEYLKHIPKNRRGTHPYYGDSMEWGTIMIYSCGLCTMVGKDEEFCQFEGFSVIQIERDV